MEHCSELSKEEFEALCLRQLRLGNISFFSANTFYADVLLRIHLVGDDAFNVWVKRITGTERYYLQKIGMQGPKPLAAEDRQELGLKQTE